MWGDMSLWNVQGPLLHSGDPMSSVFWQLTIPLIYRHMMASRSSGPVTFSQSKCGCDVGPFIQFRDCGQWTATLTIYTWYPLPGHAISDKLKCDFTLLQLWPSVSENVASQMIWRCRQISRGIIYNHNPEIYINYVKFTGLKVFSSPYFSLLLTLLSGSNCALIP